MSIHKPNPVSADAEEPFDTFSNRLPTVGHVVVVTAAIVDASARITTGATVTGVGGCVGMAMVTSGLKV